MGETIYVIDPARCTECVGHFDEPQCVVVCPVECIDPDPDIPETQDALLAKLLRLQGASRTLCGAPIRMNTLSRRWLLLVLLWSPVAWSAAPAQGPGQPPRRRGDRQRPRTGHRGRPGDPGQGRQRLRCRGGGVVDAVGGRADQLRAGRRRFLPAARRSAPARMCSSTRARPRRQRPRRRPSWTARANWTATARTTVRGRPASPACRRRWWSCPSKHGKLPLRDLAGPGDPHRQ